MSESLSYQLTPEITIISAFFGKDILLSLHEGDKVSKGLSIKFKSLHKEDTWNKICDFCFSYQAIGLPRDFILNKIKEFCDQMSINLVPPSSSTFRETSKESVESKIYYHAQEILKQVDIITLTDTEEMFLYDEKLGYWTPTVSNYILKYAHDKEDITDFLTSNLKNIENDIRGNTLEKGIDSKTFKPPRNMINANNGAVNIITKELKPFDKEYYFTNKLDGIDFNKDAPEPVEFLKFLALTLPDDISPQNSLPPSHQRMLTQEWYGVNISDEEVKNLLFAIGEKDSGKTTLFEKIMVELLGGMKNIDASTFSELTDIKSRAVAYAKDKKAIIDGDIEETYVKNISIIKKIAGGSNITSAEKYKSRDTTRINAKMTFGGNKVPILSKKVRRDDWWWENVMILKFKVNVKKILITQEKFIKGWTLVYNEIYKKEMSGILNWAIEGLQRYLERGFTYDKELTYGLWTEEEGNERPFEHFINEYFDVIIKKDKDEIFQTPTELVYELCKIYCAEMKSEIPSVDTLGRYISTLDSIIKRSTSRKFTTDKKQIYVYEGIVPQKLSLLKLSKFNPSLFQKYKSFYDNSGVKPSICPHDRVTKCLKKPAGDGVIYFDNNNPCLTCDNNPFKPPAPPNMFK